MDELLKECYTYSFNRRLSPDNFIALVDRKRKEYNTKTGYNPDPIVAEIWGTTEKSLKIDTRQREILEPRQVAMYLRKKNTKESLAKIGKRYGRDHATVLHAFRTVNNLLETDKEYRRKVESVQKRIDDERQMQMRKTNLEAAKLDNNTESVSELSIKGSDSAKEAAQINDLNQAGHSCHCTQKTS